MRINILFGLMFLVLSCKAKQKIVNPDTTIVATKNLKKDSIINKINGDQINFETLVIRANADYESSKQSLTVGADIRIKKDQKIWINIKVLGIPMAKALITPDRVAYYEKLNNTFFDGDYTILSKLVGTPLNFDKVQKLLLGKPINALNESTFEYQNINNQHSFVSQKSEELFQKYTFDVNPCVLKEQYIKQENQNREVLVNYPSHTTQQNQILPLLLNIFAKEKDEVKIAIEYKNFTFNEEVNFPFEIPSGYQEIQLK